MFNVKQKYPFLDQSWEEQNYIPAKYYNSILKDYIFDNLTDLEIFEKFLTSSNLPTNAKCLELGCGSGRVTNIFLNKQPDADLDILDFSPQMLDYTRSRFLDKKLTTISSDTINYLETTQKKYDFVYTLWSFSHSLQQQIRTRTHDEVGTVLKKFFKENMNTNGKFFLIHFDSLSEEQNVMMPLWEKLFPGTINLTTQSPSFQITTKALEEMAQDNVINYKLDHKIGTPIHYKSIKEAMEVYMNFHLEAQLNEWPQNELSAAVQHIESHLEKYKDDKGELYIKPGCFVIEVTRL